MADIPQTSAGNETPEDALLQRYRAEIERLRADAENLPCGHRKRDMDDSYGGCICCQALRSIKEDDDETERLRAELEALQHDHERQAGHLTEVVTEVERLRTALREIEEASRDDDDPKCQHYCWINDTAKEALSTGDSDSE